MNFGAVLELDRPCVTCHKHGCVQDHKWCYIDDRVLTETVLEGLGEMFRRSGHAQAPGPYEPLFHIVRNIADAERQYVWPSASCPTIFPCPPTFPSEAVDLFTGNDVDGLAGCLQDAYIAPPPYPRDGQVADDVSIGPGDVPFLDSYQPSIQYDPSPSYTASTASWAQGYVPGPNEDVNYMREPRVSLPTLLREAFVAPFGQPLVQPSFQALIPLPSPIPSISVIEHLEQGTYQQKQLVEGTPAGPIHFNAGLGVCYGALDALANGGDPAFSLGASIGVKASIRFELLQFPRKSMRQVRMRHGGGRGRKGRPITLREMGERVFEELKKLMDHAENRGDRLRHRGSVVDLEQVVLLRVDHISKGSIQPILGIRRDG
ncbi:hypothetical protein V8D89_002623 [Ganoderma adspersum]